LQGGPGLLSSSCRCTTGSCPGAQPDGAGGASGLLNTNQQMGGAMGAPTAPPTPPPYTSHYVHGHPGLSPLDGAALTHGFQIAFYVLAALAALAAVISAIMIEPGAAATVPDEGAGELTPALEEAA